MAPYVFRQQHCDGTTEGHLACHHRPQSLWLYACKYVLLLQYQQYLCRLPTEFALQCDQIQCSSGVYLGAKHPTALCLLAVIIYRLGESVPCLHPTP